MYTYIHTDYTYTHTYLQTKTYIHPHTCMYIQTRPPTHRGGAGHTIDTHIHTYIQIHTYTHTCMYIQTRPPNPQGGAGGRPLVTDQPPCTYRPLCTQTLWGGGGVGPADLDHIYICLVPRCSQTNHPRCRRLGPLWLSALGSLTRCKVCAPTSKLQIFNFTEFKVYSELQSSFLVPEAAACETCWR